MIESPNSLGTFLALPIRFNRREEIFEITALRYKKSPSLGPQAIN